MDRQSPAQPHIIYLALGANLGDRGASLREAVERLGDAVAVERMSSVYETEPAYLRDQPRFLNMALRGRTALGPHELLAVLKRIERDMGRAAGPRFGPRVIDLDILLYDDLTLATPDLSIPHPRMAERPFVLTPLAEIAPDLVPPGFDRSVGAQAAIIRGNGDVLMRMGDLADVEGWS
ncbi:MAG TPA: 2-amino-4-hydroxy-6-hydroxymethyldihydropteridine diphosphokinase [Roseiflexaceae bacterium]|nr:2-amino-4-hydroxy-6-hydroxymethyldihydropteridine diphosphokinase [Roseiflexaceae bacterium]